MLNGARQQQEQTRKQKQKQQPRGVSSHFTRGKNGENTRYAKVFPLENTINIHNNDKKSLSNI